jgi:NADH-Ubiquinone/plastoquinone (complex I), various chains.
MNAYYHSYYLKNIRAYFKMNPSGGLALIFGIVSILAIPPTGLFLVKFSPLLLFSVLVMQQ